MDRKAVNVKPFCSVPTCSNDATVKGYCNTHYQRSLRHNGDPQADKPIGLPRGPDLARIRYTADGDRYLA